jgi:hypothetical protein
MLIIINFSVYHPDRHMCQDKPEGPEGRAEERVSPCKKVSPWWPMVYFFPRFSALMIMSGIGPVNSER